MRKHLKCMRQKTKTVHNSGDIGSRKRLIHRSGDNSKSASPTICLLSRVFGPDSKSLVFFRPRQ